MTYLRTRLSLILLIALFYVLFYNGGVIFHRFELHKAVPGLALLEAVEEVFYALALAIALFYAFSFHHIAFLVALPTIFVTSALASYFIHTYHITLNSGTIALLFETTPAEASGFISIRLLLWLMLAVTAAFIGVWAVYKFAHKDVNDRKLCLIAGIFAVSIFLFDCDGIGNKYLPYNYLKETANYLTERDSAAPVQDIARYPAIFHPTSDKALTIVVIIGESARADHFHINGYARQTTPLIEKIPNLVSFDNVYACAILTRDSLPCMLTRVPFADRNTAPKETSLISIFKKLGFHTAWLGTQGTYSAIDTPYTRIAREADRLVFLDTDLYATYALDEALFPFLDAYLNEVKGNKLVLLHTFGSHWHYESRYPDKFRAFTPICTKKLWSRDMSHCKDEELVNSYDNTILYTDYIISSTIERLKNTNAMVVYISDHGESLGENGIYMHGMRSTKEQRYVPMLWWTSDRFIAGNVAKHSKILQHKNSALRHANLFHSMLDCAGITSELVDKKLSICY